MDFGGHHFVQRGIYGAVAGNAIHPLETGGHDQDFEVPAARGGSGVARVLMGYVGQREVLRV